MTSLLNSNTPCAPALSPNSNPLILKENLRVFNLKIEFESQLLEIQKLRDPKPCTIANHSLQASQMWSDRVWSKQHPVLHNIEGNFQKNSSLRFSLNSNSILINSLGSLVVWSPTNVGKKIELLRGQIKAT
jgi:hypothetical protein